MILLLKYSVCVRWFARQKKGKKKRASNKKNDQTRFSSLNDFIFVPCIFPPEPFRSLKYSIGTIAKQIKII